METILGTKILTKTKKFIIDGVDIDFGNGTQAQFERMRWIGSGNGVAIVAIEKDGSDSYVYLIEHFCVGTERREYLLPGGHREEGDTLIDAANKELQEEIGLISQNITLLCTVASPAYIGGLVSICLAQDLTPSSLPGDEIEEVIVHKILYDDALAMIRDGRIVDMKTITGLLYAKFLNY